MSLLILLTSEYLFYSLVPLLVIFFQYSRIRKRRRVLFLTSAVFFDGIVVRPAASFLQQNNLWILSGFFSASLLPLHKVDSLVFPFVIALP